MNINQALGQLRHILGAAGAYLVASGHATDDQWSAVMTNWDNLIGAGMFLAAAGWSLYSPEKKQ